MSTKAWWAASNEGVTFSSLDERLDNLTVNAGDYGYVGDGVTDDTQAILDGLAAITAFSGGTGGGVLVLPRTPTGIAQVTHSEIELTSGQYIAGDGARGVMIRGNGAGPLIASASDGGGDPLNNYGGLENLFLYNQSADAAALCVDFHQFGVLQFNRVAFQGAAADGYMARLRACILVDFLNRCRMGGSGASACDVALLLNGNNNVVHLHGISITDAQSAVKSLGGVQLVIDGASHFEQLAGGAVRNTAIAIDGTLGGVISGNYFESNPCPSVVFYEATAVPYGFEIGENYHTNMGSPAIDASNLRNGEVAPQVIVPGANSVNANGVLANGNFSGRVASPRLASGSGTPVTLVTTVASAATIALPDNGRDWFSISGTTNISTITATGWLGRTITLVFQGVLTVSASGNLLLAGGVGFATSANDTLTLCCDGTNWRENARSVN